MSEATSGKLDFWQRPREALVWAPPVRSAEADHHPQRRAVAIGRAREASIEQAYGANALRIHRDAVVGVNFRLNLRPDAELLGMEPKGVAEWARLVEREWEAYANGTTFDADAQRRQTFTFLMHTAYASLLTSGEALGLVKWKESLGGSFTCLHLIEPERLSQPRGEPERPTFQRGIETDEDGAPIAYHIRERHPADGLVDSAPVDKWTRVPRTTPWGRPIVLHMYDHFRPDMRRGISAFLSALPLLKMVEEHDNAELQAAIIQAGFAAVIKTELDYKDAMGVLGARPDGAVNSRAEHVLAYMQGIAPYHKEMGLTVNGSGVAHLLPGESLEIVKPAHPGLAFEAFQGALVRKLAAALGTSAESLSRDFSRASYASARMSLLDIWRHFLRMRAMLITQFAMPFFGAWLEEQIDSGRIPLPDGRIGTLEDFLRLRPALVRGTFHSWGMPQVDPIKERKGQELALAAGLTTLADEAAAEGKDWEDIMEQRRREAEYAAELGLPNPYPDPASVNAEVTLGEDIGETGAADRA